MPTPRSPQPATEAWFLTNGLPAVLRPGALLRHILARSASALTFFAVLMANSVLLVTVTGKHSVDIYGAPTRTDWFVLTLLVLVIPIAALAGRWVSHLPGHRARNTAAGVALVIVAASSLHGGPSPLPHVDLLIDIVVVTVIFLCTATGIGSVLGWAARVTSENLASVGSLLLRALPVLLLTVLVFFNSQVWSMASRISRGRLWAALIFLFLIAAVFLISHAYGSVRPILRGAATGIPLSRSERLNVGLIVALSLLIQVLTVAAVTGAIFLVLGLLLVSPEVLDAWTHGGAHDGQFLGMTLPVPDALIQVTMFLTALTFMYLAAKAVTDKQYRAQFLDPLIDDLRVTLAARDRYRTASADRAAR